MPAVAHRLIPCVEQIAFGRKAGDSAHTHTPSPSHMPSDRFVSATPGKTEFLNAFYDTPKKLKLARWQYWKASTINHHQVQLRHLYVHIYINDARKSLVMVAISRLEQGKARKLGWTVSVLTLAGHQVQVSRCL